MKIRPFLFGSVATFVLFTAISLKATPRTPCACQSELEGRPFGEPTELRREVMSKRDRARGSLFAGHKGLFDKTIVELVAESPREPVMLLVGTPLDMVAPVTTADRFSYLANLRSQSDLAVRAVPTSKTSRLTSDEFFLYTDYDLRVLEVFSTTSADPVATGMSITWPGGRGTLDGTPVLAVSSQYLPPAVGSEYVFFLSYRSDSETYVPVGPGAAFHVTSSSISPLTKSSVPPVVVADVTKFLADLRSQSQH